MHRSALLSLALACASSCLAVDLTGRPCPCLDGFACVDDVCVASDAPPGQVKCPSSFLAADACDGPPPAQASLQAVCDDGHSLPAALVEEVGAGLGTCTGAPVTAALTSSAVTGSLVYTEGAAATAQIQISGDVTFSLAIPESCKIDAVGCLPSDGSGTCATAADGCACTGVSIDAALDRTLSFSGGRLNEGATVFGCARDGGYILRENSGGNLGPIFVFQ